jgi:predicted enzyme related to lactoylglutathione lyase
MGSPFETSGAFSWCELMTTDLGAAKKYYKDLFGWELEDMPAAAHGMTYTVVKVGGNAVGGIMPMPRNLPPGVPPNWGAYVTVPDVDATAKKAAELGGIILVQPQDIPNVGRFTVIRDPQGAVINAITYKKM